MGQPRDQATSQLKNLENLIKNQENSLEKKIEKYIKNKRMNI